MRIAYLDCFAGIAGDMFLGALVDAGVPHTVLQEATNALDLNASLQFETVDRSGITATKVHVLEAGVPAEVTYAESDAPQLLSASFSGHAHPHVHPHVAPQQSDVASQAHVEVHGRSLTEIRHLLQASTLSAAVKDMALRTFDLLGNAEAKIHNVPVDEIHFHEVGAVDAIVDIVATCAGIVHLGTHFGVDAWHCSPINVGSGTVRCAHGVFPVPAPATAALLRGVPTYAAHVQKELVTPTGAALLRALAPTFGTQPAMAIDNIGYGAGTRNPAGFANVLRLSIGTAVDPPRATHAQPDDAEPTHARHHAPDATTVAVLETAIDDATPQLLAYVAEQALAQGALDVMLTPVVMKKGRPATLLTLLADPQDASRFADLLLRETTTLGVRIREDRRICLDRAHIPVATTYGTVRIKTGSLHGEVLNAHPEYEDCRRLAAEHNVPLKRVHAVALAAYANRTPEEDNA